MRIPVHRRRKQAALIFSATPSIICLRDLTLLFVLCFSNSEVPKGDPDGIAKQSEDWYKKQRVG